MSNEVELMKLFLGTYRNVSVRLFRRNVINKTMQDLHSGNVHQVKAGIVGQSDVYGYVKSQPAIPFEVEFKAAKGRESNEQVTWRQFCGVWGIPHLILRSAIDESTEQTLSRWSLELNAFTGKL